MSEGMHAIRPMPTPGPWRVKPTSQPKLVDIQPELWSHAIATVHANAYVGNDPMTDAALIATAPELYRELEARLDQTRCSCGQPACKRCQDDAETERVLAMAIGDTRSTA